MVLTTWRKHFLLRLDKSVLASCGLWAAIHNDVPLGPWSILLITHGTWDVYLNRWMRTQLQERSGIAVRSVKKLCPCRNLSPLNFCNICSQWRHFLHTVLLAPVFLFCIQCDNSQERGNCVCVSSQVHWEHPLYVFLWQSHLSLISPSPSVSVLYYRSSSTLQGKVGKHWHPTCLLRAIFSCQHLWTLREKR